MEEAGDTLRRRFAALSPANLVPGLQFVACRGSDRGDEARLEAHEVARPPPAALSGIWLSVGTTGFEDLPGLSDASLERVNFMVVVCDVFDAAQREAAHNLLLWLDLRELAPPVAMIPVRMRGADGSRAFDLVRGMLDAWVHDVVYGEPAGLELALAIRCSFAKVQAKSERVMDEFRARALRVDRLRALKAGVNMTLWQYVPPRFGLTLPAVNNRLGDEDGEHLAGYAVRRRLGRGAFGQVFELEPPPGAERQRGGEVVKIICKTMIRSVRDLRQLQRIWQIMQMLSGRWQHPNIARSFQLYNSPTRIYIRMEHAGSENLYHRLRARDTGSRPFCLPELHGVVRQVVSAVKHLHTGPRICHRDVKPENVVLSATGAGVAAKLIDFDTAMVFSDRVSCRATCGTFPFMAPEVAEKEYNGIAADMWSVGLVMLEMACQTRIVERCLADLAEEPLEEKHRRGCPRRAVQRLREAFGAEAFAQGVLVRRHAVGLQPALAAYGEAIGSLAILDASARWTSQQLEERLPAAFQASPEGETGARGGHGGGQEDPERRDPQGGGP